MEAITLAFRRVEGFPDDEFYDFCLDNNNLKFERRANGEIIVMPNTGGITGNRNSEINFQLRAWNCVYRKGLCAGGEIESQRQTVPSTRNR